MALRAASVGSNDEINFSPMGQGLGGSGSPRGSLSVATSLPDSVDLDNLVGPGAVEQKLKYHKGSMLPACLMHGESARQCCELVAQALCAPGQYSRLFMALRTGCMRPQPRVTAS